MPEKTNEKAAVGKGEAPANVEEATSRERVVFTQSEIELMSAMRALWEQHVAWTRMTIISIAANLPDQDLVSQRLLRNAKDMGNLLRPLYGNKVANEFSYLIREHLLIAARLVKAAKAGNSREAAQAEREWYENADDIAAFLNSINPNIAEAEMRDMLHQHLALTKSEALARLSGNFARDIAIYDKIERQALAMADAITTGIVEQFPNKFGVK
jgi:hypothetical protein